jgi:NAD(P)-dependent dehydrogenase (short-subunit alcohol dehydrogenase family)
MFNILAPPFARLYPNSSWNESAIPELAGKVAIVTGGNTGLGFETCRRLATRGAKVYLAARSEEKGAKAVETIKVETGNKNVELLLLNLADIKDVRRTVTLDDVSMANNTLRQRQQR